MLSKILNSLFSIWILFSLLLNKIPSQNKKGVTLEMPDLSNNYLIRWWAQN